VRRINDVKGDGGVPHGRHSKRLMSTAPQKERPNKRSAALPFRPARLPFLFGKAQDLQEVEDAINRISPFLQSNLLF
jgi:hypothetical protein